jgi:hypothetical protein
VNDASENGVSTDHGVDVRFGARDRHHKAEPAMRSSRVVVPDVLDERLFQVRSPRTRIQSRHSSRTVRTKRSA